MTVELVSLGELATILGVSEPTLRKAMTGAADFPIESRGKNGEAYQIPAVAAVEWWRAREAAEEAERAARAERIRGMQLELLGPDAALGDASDVLSPAEQSAQIDAELRAIKLGRERRELVRFADVEAVAAQFMAEVGKRYTSLTDRLRKLVDIDAETAGELDRLIARDLNELADAAERVRDLTVATEADSPGDPAV